MCVMSIRNNATNKLKVLMHTAAQADLLSEGPLCTNSLHNPESDSLTKSVSSAFQMSIAGAQENLPLYPLKKIESSPSYSLRF